MPGRRRPRLLVLNQYYHPGVEATAHLLTELCEALADDYDVTAITGRLLGHEDDPDYERKMALIFPRPGSRPTTGVRLFHGFLDLTARALA